jgi:SAM-dependent methyltransferase
MTMSIDGWYADSPFVAETYDLVDPFRKRGDVGFFVDAAKEAAGLVLEIGCGTGRVLIPTARAGVNIVGLDLSSSMLAVCRNRLQQESEAVQSRAHLIQRDMREFTLGQSFDLITLPFTPFEHLIAVHEQMSCLQSIRRHLNKNGRVILDLVVPLDVTGVKMGEESDGEPPFLMPDGRRVVRRNKLVSHDRFNQVTHAEAIYYVTHPDGHTERLVYTYRLRHLFRYEAEHLLVLCGFELMDVYGGFDKSPYGSKCPGKLILVARKAA